ncbi:MAG: helix-turn-helix transcriptional regulator [Bacteroidaceae bacterium]|nr:helix-turn-helix transcriptional regulator [Bacteroidaceae bacterium]
MKNRIREVMLKANLSQQDFATKLGVSPASISNIFMGRTNPTITHASAVHKAFPSVRMNWLLFGEGDMMEGENSETILEGEGDNLAPSIELGDDALFPLEGGETSTLGHPSSQKEAQSVARHPQGGNFEARQNVRPQVPVDLPDYGIQNRFSTYNEMQNAKMCDKPERKVKEIRVFFDDGTYEIFIPAMK